MSYCSVVRQRSEGRCTEISAGYRHPEQRGSAQTMRAFLPLSKKQIIWRKSRRGGEEGSAQKLVCLLPALQVISTPFQGLASPPVAGCQVRGAAVERSLSRVLSTLGSTDMLKL